jgi:lipoprotein-anchoring transpeptidase ErfK/SrfK
MKLTKETLKRIIKEEMSNLMNEGNQDETLKIIGAALKKALPGRELRTRKHKKIPTIIVIQSGSEALAEVDPEGSVAVYPIIYDNEELMSKVQANANGIQINTSYGENS